MYKVICFLLLFIAQAGFAYENSGSFSDEAFTTFIIQLKTLENSSPKSAIKQIEAIDFARFSDLQQLLVIDVIFPAYINQGKLAKADNLNRIINDIANKLSLDEYRVTFLINEYVLNTTAGRKERALKSITKAKDLATIKRIDKLQAKVLMYLGNYYRDIANSKEAEAQYHEALILVDSDKLRAQILNQLGSVNNLQGRPLLAITYLQEALAIHVKNNNLLEVSNAYYNIAQTNFNMQNFDLALQNFIETNRIDKELGNKNNEAYSATRICSLYGWFEQFEKAKEKCDEAKEIFTKQNSKSNMAGVNNSLGQSYFKQGKFTELKLLMNETLTTYSEVTNQYVLIKTRLLMIKALIGLKEFSKAKTFALKVKETANENNYATYSENILLLLSKINAGLEDNAAAIEYAHEYIKVSRESRKKVEDKRVERHKNSIDFISKERDVARLSYQKTLTEKALALKNEQLKLWGSITLIIIILILGFSYIVLQKRRLSLKEKDLLDEIIQNKNQLLADVSHELRTPLTVLKMQIQSLEFNIEDDKEQAYLSLHRRIGEINRLIADIYELSRADAGDLDLNITRISPYNLLADWCNDTQVIFENVDGLDFSHKINLNNALVINVDQSRFIQVLTNLVSNSRRYTNKPGRILFTASEVNRELVLLMEDSSPGVEPDDFSRIFERLYRVDQSRSREYGGSGLGLAICKSLTEAQGGRISAKASLLGGLAIEIRLSLNSKTN